ncbi:SH3 domain-containing protein 19 [Tribolium castaneum]|uniref:SH3 domain-containing protein 19 n=1 Tax=Tribolium castaneum TaxID=7070 RepID=UPI0030FE6557
MFHQKSKKKPPPRPPPPNFMKYKSKSSYNLTQGTPNLIEWSPPSSPKAERTHQFGGSVSSSYSSSTSSLTSSKKSLENDNSVFNITWLSNTSTAVKPRIIRAAPPKKGKDEASGSPPMPKVPPPSPPKGGFDVVTPYGIALFDFPATQPGDLPLQVNDVVELIRRVNSEWLYGKVCDREGIFPESFIQVQVPLPGEDQIVTVLYEFTPQMAGDLPLKPGQKIKVIRKVSDDWLYGECNGLKGQFPRNFVS